MPVNTAALKTFAPAMRRQLLEAVGRKLDLLLNSQTPDTLSTYARQIAELREQEADSREQLLERVAYTWFNRLCALRYLDARGWHPFGCKVLMAAAEGETQPELLKLMRAGSLPGELKPHTNEARLHGLLDGQIPPAMAGSDPQGEVYRELVLASCRSYHQMLPELFEGLDDASELLLPDDLLSEGSIAGGFRTEISDEDCEDVEIIGWLYQFYISEKKDQVIGKVVKSEDIPAATQLFTPNWIVKYMVQNTLGATWLATYPDSPLKGQMEFYIEPAEQAEDVKQKYAETIHTKLNPEAITLMDPACGSGHILVEAYEVLKAIYLEQGYQLREIPMLILEKNLFGLDIDERAAQLAIFALMMKGRADDRRLFERGAKLNVMALQNSADFDPERLAEEIISPESTLQLNDLTELTRVFEHATTLGSLIQVPVGLIKKLPLMQQLSQVTSQTLLFSKEITRFRLLVRQACILTAQYDTVVANPPYIGAKGMNPAVKMFARDYYPDSKNDLYTCFIKRSLALSNPAGRIGIVAPFGWMFLSSYEHFRLGLLREVGLSSLIQLEYNAFEPACIPVATFTFMRRRVEGLVGSYIRLSDFKGHQNQAPRTKEAIKNPDCGWLYRSRSDDFKTIPGSPVAYWISDAFRKIFTGDDLESHFWKITKGIFTGDNARFLRLWHEVSDGNKCWQRYDKAGGARRWYGLASHVVDWRNSGEALKSSDSAGLGAAQYYGKPHVVWSGLTSGAPSFRQADDEVWFDDVSPAIVDRELDFDILCFLNSIVALRALYLINPTLHYQVGDVRKLPVPKQVHGKEIIRAHCVSIARRDWDAYERSWDFQALPLLAVSSNPAQTLEAKYLDWIKQNKAVISEMKRLEEENNQLYIDAYGLGDELSSEVSIEQITLTVNPIFRYAGDGSEEEKWQRFQRDSMSELLSYATGCMLGRYSLDHPGLILAESRESQAEQLTAYEDRVGKPLSEVQFKPDPDGIIPVLDGEWFEDDIVARTREFLAVTFPESSDGENLRFIEESLGKDLRKYFCTEFYKDHLQTYKKRPIYWMVQSPKKGFACLIYLHRYTKDTLNQVLNNYFRPYLQKLEARLAQLEQDQINDDLKPRERTAARKEAEKITKVMKECQAWEQDALLPLAQQRIELDLDDGVKVNYLKLQDVLATIPGLAAKED
jgi:hypothetical protein